MVEINVNVYQQNIQPPKMNLNKEKNVFYYNLI